MCTADSEEWSPTAGVARSFPSGTAGRLAAPLRGRHSRREDGGLDHLSRCCAACGGWDRLASRMAAFLEGAFACSSLSNMCF